MAHSLSAKKRVKQDAVKRIRNRARKSMVKTEVKKLEATIAEGNIEKAQEQLCRTVKKIDKIASSSTMHKNTASRMKSRLTKKFNTLKNKS